MIPKEGEEALVVNGPLVESRVRVVKIHKEEDFCEAVIVSGENAWGMVWRLTSRGKVVKKMFYDDICKVIE